MFKAPTLVPAAVWMTAQSIAWYYYNVGSLEFVKTFQEKLGHAFEGGYEEEQMRKFERGFPFHFGELDHERQQVLMLMITDRYAMDAVKAHDMLFEGETK